MTSSNLSANVQNRLISQFRTQEFSSSIKTGGAMLRRLVSGLKGRMTESGSDPIDRLNRLCSALLEEVDVASKLALGSEIAQLYEQLDRPGLIAFFTVLSEEFALDWARARRAWTQHEALPSRGAARALLSALEPPRLELFRRINSTDGGTAILIRMRADLLEVLRAHPELEAVDDDLRDLLQSWFNIGFLELSAIDWTTSAGLLERVIQYEAVHPIIGFSDLRRRLLPVDRRCYGFFHPAMPDEPLIFVEIALTKDVPGSIQALLADDREIIQASSATTAVFYSISNCQAGLQGISFGDHLIKAVVSRLSKELPNLKTFVTLSPIPGFRKWLESTQIATLAEYGLTGDDLDTDAIAVGSLCGVDLRKVLMPLAARYLLDARDSRDRPLDPVARFHLGNGARVDRLCWAGDTSGKGIAGSAGVMVNYRYDPSRRSERPPAAEARTSVKASRQVQLLARVGN